MMTVSKFASAHHAAAYYDHDDYYAEAGQAPSGWHGKGAERLGLFGEVDRELMHSIMNGELPAGDRVGMEKDGEWQHAPGFDATLSAPKSVSVMALAGGDTRLIQAHRESVKAALNFIEERVAACRIREAGEIRREETGNLLIASFDHSTSREQDPQLHSHNLIMNVTQDANGIWRSLEASELFKIHHEANRVYQQSLAQHTLAMGYNIERTKHGWEIQGIDDLSRGFSSRKDAIDAWLEANGYDRETASAEIRQRATLATRPPKEVGADRGAMMANWRQRAAELGYNLDTLVPGKEKERGAEEVKEEAKAVADKAVGRAAAHLAERKSRFTYKEIVDRALKEASGENAALDDIKEAISRSAELKPAQTKTEKGREPGFTTAKAIKAERAMLSIEAQGREYGKSITSTEDALAIVERANAESEWPWNNGQKAATAGILCSTARIQALQGDAGTAKTTTVIKTVAEVAQEKDIGVIGLAPTASAAEQLAEGGKLGEAYTVDKFLADLRRQEPTGQEQIWVVDEAAMLSAEKMKDLLRASEQHEARVVLVGDTNQLASIEAGAAFRQLQEAGIQTHKLDEIVRQRNEHTKEAVEASIRGDIETAMKQIEHSGTINEMNDPTERRKAIAKAFLSKTQEERSDTIVLDSTRAGRNELNTLIREGLKQEGALKGEDLAAQRMESKDMTRVEKSRADNYESGDFVTFGRDLKSAGIEKGEYYQVADIDINQGTVTLQNDQGQELTWKPEQASAAVTAYQEAETQLAIGDQLIWKQNNQDLGLKNGDRLTIENFEKGVVIAQDQRGKQHHIDTSQRQGQHFDYAYASTVYSAQGRTADTVLANVASEDKALLSQQQFYVAASRAKEGVHLYTDNKESVTSLIKENSGQKETALDKLENQAQMERDAKEREREAEAKREIEAESQKQYQIATGKSREDFKKEREAHRNRDREHTYEMGL